MKTVAHLIPNYNPFPPVYPAGTELRVEQVSLRQSRYRPVVICGGFPGQPARERIGPMEVRRIHIGRVYRRLLQKITRLDPWPYTTRMWQQVQREKAALVHIHNEPKLLTALAPRLRQAGLPVVVHVANEKPIMAETIPLVDCWLGASDYIGDWLRNENGIPAERVRTLYTGVDLATREPWWRERADWRRAVRRGFGVDDEEAVTILFAGRIVRDKGVNELLDAFQILRRRSPRPLRLLLAGNIVESKDPNNEKATYGAAMKARFDSEPDVRWIGSLPPHDIHAFLLAGDLFALPSQWPDPFPTVMLEAAAAGLPILGSRLGGIVEFLGAAPENLLVDDWGNARAWAERMLPLVEDAGRRRASGEWLRERVEEQYDWSRVTREFEDLYDELLAAPRP